jgi:RimJ/RimL family protein N-acetyltransferase
MDPADLSRSGVRLRAVAAADVDRLRSILHSPAVFARWGDDDADPSWPFDDPDAVRYCVEVEGAVVGMVQYGEEPTPMYRHASIDIFLDASVHGRGVGRTAVYLVARYLIDERGHHRIVIDPAADNDAAIRCYASVGFRPVGRMREYERDPRTGAWRDGLLMDLLAGELTEPGPVS